MLNSSLEDGWTLYRPAVLYSSLEVGWTLYRPGVFNSSLEDGWTLYRPGVLNSSLEYGLTVYRPVVLNSSLEDGWTLNRPAVLYSSPDGEMVGLCTSRCKRHFTTLYIHFITTRRVHLLVKVEKGGGRIFLLKKYFCFKKKYTFIYSIKKG